VNAVDLFNCGSRSSAKPRGVPAILLSLSSNPDFQVRTAESDHRKMLVLASSTWSLPAVILRPAPIAFKPA
jgi:hypothetical protein